MLRGLSADPRVPQAAKLEMSAAIAYLVTGRGRVPRVIPVVGRIDALAVAAFALRRLLAAVDEPVLRSHWRGSTGGLDALLATTAALAAPGGRLRRVAVAGAAASFLRDRIGSTGEGPSGYAERRGERPSQRGQTRRAAGFGRVIPGEVLARREERR
ncbi:MAG: hypothetical protein JWN96_4397 [Mycobacterium sp.]|jgi:uncharacterized membrane protein YkvA (DUF1232 family)|nr:hypothetical protein [Mycobacterium sp.]